METTMSCLVYIIHACSAVYRGQASTPVTVQQHRLSHNTGRVRPLSLWYVQSVY